MKTIVRLGLLAAFLSPLAGNAYEALCAGGPRVPSYAFRYWEDAERCAKRIASFSHACARDVRTAHCITKPHHVNAVRPEQCRCNPGVTVGSWD